jgi:hypothetical protein
MDKLRARILELDDSGQVRASIERVPYDPEAGRTRSSGDGVARRVRREAPRRRIKKERET